MLFGEIALSFLRSPTTGRAAKDFITAKLTPLCGSIGAFSKQQNENNAAGATQTAGQPRNFRPVGPVAESDLAAPAGRFSLSRHGPSDYAQEDEADG